MAQDYSEFSIFNEKDKPMAGSQYQRLSDKILEAFKLTLDQGDVDIADILNNALQMAMTRGAGGKDFVERREFADDVEKALEKYETLRAARRVI